SSSLTYDANTDQYIYTWKTDKSWAGTCRQLIVQLNDTTAHLANFDFK
ncbi:MAG: PxKF domain-containing protein, partial [Caldilineaceae bacterium]|nr:PxKF domain-containing protein [Caldilineaceae bacterium]